MPTNRANDAGGAAVVAGDELDPLGRVGVVGVDVFDGERGGAGWVTVGWLVVI